MAQNRTGEEGFHPFRSERIFSVGASWYFASREGDFGPFPSREFTQQQIELYVSEILESQPQLKKA